MPRRLVFVCTGNTCRSPLAEAMARAALRAAGLGLVEVASAGLSARAGDAAAAEAVAVAAQRGLDLTRHRARGLSSIPTDAHTLLLTMTPDQIPAARAQVVPEAMVEALLPYARSLGAPSADDAVSDPLGRGAEVYRDTAAALDAALRAIVRAWSAEFTGAAESPQTKTLALPRLGGLRPTLESTALKLQEEAGELAEAIGKYRTLSGERPSAGRSQRAIMAAVGQELLDVAQTAVTMMFVLEEQYGMDLQSLLDRHVHKLAAKGYLGGGATQEASPTSAPPVDESAHPDYS